MLFIESLGKVYDCPLKDNRQVDDSGGDRPYQRVDSLAWSPAEWAHGKTIKIKGFPKDHKVHVFRVAVSTHRTDWVVTNDSTQDSAEATRKVCGFRWRIEQLHREGKQVTGLERSSAARCWRKAVSASRSYCMLITAAHKRAAPCGRRWRLWGS